MKKPGMSSLMQQDSKAGRGTDALPVAGQRRAKTGHLRSFTEIVPETFERRAPVVQQTLCIDERRRE
nr:hypothetical protein [Paraburkholderia sp. BL8N3]